MENHDFKKYPWKIERTRTIILNLFLKLSMVIVNWMTKQSSSKKYMILCLIKREILKNFKFNYNEPPKKSPNHFSKQMSMLQVSIIKSLKEF